MSVNGGFLVYDKLAFQDFIDYNTRESDEQNPLPSVPLKPIVELQIPNPHVENGTIESIDSIENGEKVAVLYSNGKITIHSSDMSQELDTIETIISNATGLSSIPGGMAVSDNDNIYLVDSSGGITETWNLFPLSPINEISWDSAFGRMLAATTDGIYEVMEDKSLSMIKTGDSNSIEAVKMNDYYNMFAQNNMFYVFTIDGAYNPNIAGKSRSYNDNDMTGLTFSNTNGYVSTPDYIIKYAKADFQDFVDYLVHDKTLLADFDDSGKVDRVDLARFAEEWLQPDSIANIHIDGNNIVNFRDFSILANEWGMTEIWYGQ